MLEIAAKNNCYLVAALSNTYKSFNIFRHVTYTHTNNTGQITLSVDAEGREMTVIEKAEVKIEMISCQVHRT